MPRARTQAFPVIAIDGPAGAGKSTVARSVAQRLGVRYLDTGAMYRALTWQVLRQGLIGQDQPAIIALAQSADLQVGTDPAAPTISIDGHDVTGPVRGPAVTAAVSEVSAIAGVRAAMVRRQRQIMAAGRIVAEGRDIGSVVAPLADLKIFLTASAEVRARRRAADLGQPRPVTAVQAELQVRDRLDSSRAASPLVCPPDAVTIDSSGLGPEGVIDLVLQAVRQVSPR